MAYVITSQTIAKSREISQAVASSSDIRVRVEVKGEGEVQLTGAKGVVFGAMMLEEPHFTYGVVCAEGTPLNLGIPTGLACVLAWKKTENFWIGADMGFLVTNPTEKPLVFTCVFTGSALRTTQPVGRM